MSEESRAAGAMPPCAARLTAARRLYRHPWPVRLGHWLNVLCVLVLIMSGLQIFNAHPALYWGDRSDRDRAVLTVEAGITPGGEWHGVTTLAGHPVDTTGILGYASGLRRAFPAWATLPGPQWLAMGRRWHLFFAWAFLVNGLLFGLYAWRSRHLFRDLLPKWPELRHIGRDLWRHLTFRHPAGGEARQYNVMQKLAYTGVIFGLGPLIVLTGLSMSPAFDAALPRLPDVFGGRQSARTVHFLGCVAFMGFIIVHLLMVATTGLARNLRSMVTGWVSVAPEGHGHDAQACDESRG